MNKDQILILQKAIDHFGMVKQIMKASEECIELAHALNDLAKDPLYLPNIKQVEEEIADVKIIINQIMFMYPKMDLKPWLDKKIKRLEERIKENAS